MKVREIIGRTALTITKMWNRLRYGGLSIDMTVPDYTFWDRFRRGRAKGFEFAGLFAMPITEIIAGWVMGTGIQATLDHQHTDGELATWLGNLRGMLLQIIIDLYGLGDQYLVVNPDNSISIASPEIIETLYDELDYRHVVGYIITTQLEKALVTDEYRLDGRTITIKWNDDRPPAVFEYANLIGRLPIVHFPCDRAANETHGRPIYERLYHLFSRYDDLIEKMIDGAELMGNPIPTFEGMEDVDETIDRNSEPTDETYTDEEGNERSRIRIAFDRLSAIFVGKGGLFKFSSPQVGWTKDVSDVLRQLLVLIMYTSRIPEAVWGNELSSARASAQEQMKTFYAYIEGRRLALEPGLRDLVDIWLRTRALTDRRIRVGDVTLQWSPLSEGNEEMIFKWTEWAYRVGLVRRETALARAELVEDAAAEVAAALEESEAERDRFEREEDEGAQDDEPLMDELEAAA